MNAENLLQYLTDPSNLDEISYGELQDIIAQFPFCQGLYYLLVQKSKEEKHLNYEKDLLRAATYSIDRTLLHKQLLLEAATEIEESLELKSSEVLNLESLPNLEVVNSEPTDIDPPITVAPLEVTALTPSTKEELLPELPMDLSKDLEEDIPLEDLLKESTTPPPAKELSIIDRILAEDDENDYDRKGHPLPIDLTNVISFEDFLLDDEDHTVEDEPNSASDEESPTIKSKDDQQQMLDDLNKVEEPVISNQNEETPEIIETTSVSDDDTHQSDLEDGMASLSSFVTVIEATPTDEFIVLDATDDDPFYEEEIVADTHDDAIGAAPNKPFVESEEPVENELDIEEIEDSTEEVEANIAPTVSENIADPVQEVQEALPPFEQDILHESIEDEEVHYVDDLSEKVAEDETINVNNTLIDDSLETTHSEDPSLIETETTTETTKEIIVEKIKEEIPFVVTNEETSVIDNVEEEEIKKEIKPTETLKPLPKDSFSSWLKKFTPPVQSLKETHTEKETKKEDTVETPINRTKKIKHFLNKKKKKEKKKKKKEKRKSHPIAEKSVHESEDVLSETLADLLAIQGYMDKAIDMYKRLSLIFPEKSAFFALKIEELKHLNR